jgi:hypothetical protein
LRAVVRLATVLAVFIGVTVLHLPVSYAVEVPQTLADRRPVGAGPVVSPFPIDHLGVIWDVAGEPAGHAGDEAAGHGEVRFQVAGTWGTWQPLDEDGAAAAGQWASALVPAGDAEAYQVRGLPADAVAARAVALNTTDGPRVEVGRRPAGAHAVSNCVSRAEWGADETLRFNGTTEIWPTEFHPAQTMTVHHTVTANDDPTPAATVRAIYRYHAVDRGWGDIGYHHLVDESGRVYEGRWSGAASARCDSGGDGTHFAHEEHLADVDHLVTAGHTASYNSGNLGVALLGTFTTSRKDGAEPQPAAVDALETVLAEFAVRHGLDPLATVTYVNPVTKASKTVEAISGHRDWSATECPGDRLYDDLPAIRDAVAARMAAPTGTGTAAPPSVSAVDPAAAWANTSVSVKVTGADFAAGARLELRNGDGAAPTLTNVAVVDAVTITATVTVPKGGKPGSYPWDVVVTNPDGTSDVLDNGFTVLR